MSISRITILAGMISYSLLVTACGSSQFGSSGKTASSSKPEQASASSNATAQTTDSAQAAPAGSSTDASAFGSSQFSAVSAQDVATPGCTLPASVSKLMMGAVSANLTGWGGAGSNPDLKNLNLSSCDWFTKAKAAGIARYMVVFTDTTKNQSYAQPYTGAANAVAFAACLAQGAAASSAAGGAVTCEFMPF